MTLTSGYRAEISRKVLHLLSATTPIVYLFLERGIMLWLLGACLVIALTVELLRHSSATCGQLFKRWVGFMVRAVEWGRLCGATYVLVGALLTVWLFPKPIAIAALFVQSISDSAASLIGLRFGRSRFLGKSLAGSLAFFVTALVILWVALPGARGVAFAAALVATLVEALPAPRLGRLELNDNLTIPLLTGATVWLLQTSPGPAQLASLLRNSL